MKIKRFNESKGTKDDFTEIKTVMELIEYLEDIIIEEGNIEVCYSQDHEYWGSIQSRLTKGYNLGVSNSAQPDGPKSGITTKAVVFGVD